MKISRVGREAPNKQIKPQPFESTNKKSQKSLSFLKPISPVPKTLFYGETSKVPLRCYYLYILGQRSSV